MIIFNKLHKILTKRELMFFSSGIWFYVVKSACFWAIAKLLKASGFKNIIESSVRYNLLPVIERALYQNLNMSTLLIEPRFDI